MRTLHDGADHDAWAAVLARNLRHRGVPDRKIRRSPEHRGESLGVAAGRGHLHVEAVFLEDAGMHTDIEIDVTEIVDGFAETHLLERRGAGKTRADGRNRETARDGGGSRQKIAAAK